MTYAYCLARAARHTDRLSVLDWGGAAGQGYLLSRALLPEVDFNYHVRDLPGNCALGRRKLPSVHFHESMATVSGPFDFVVNSSALQYEEEWQRRLAALAQYARSFLLLTRIPIVFQQTTFVTLQRPQSHGYGTEFLGWTFNRDDLVEEAEACGLQLEREFLLDGEYYVAGSPETVTQMGFLFRPSEPRETT
jgi:putative methyltransferase (TIGR04325 family)